MYNVQPPTRTTLFNLKLNTFGVRPNDGGGNRPPDSPRVHRRRHSIRPEY